MCMRVDDGRAAVGQPALKRRTFGDAAATRSLADLSDHAAAIMNGRSTVDWGCLVDSFTRPVYA
jgi:hypothetical protein